LVGGWQAVEAANVEITWGAARGLDAESYVSHARRLQRRPRDGVQQAAEFFEAYEKIKIKRGVIDFDDVLLDVLREADRDADFADSLRWRFRHLLVDEAQDLNPVQHRVVDMLRSGRDDLFLVGDPAQAIYGFNGADPAIITDVAGRFPGIEVVRLPINHRSTPQIVETGAHVLAAGGHDVDIVSARGDGPMPVSLVYDDESTEADAISHRIASFDPVLVRSGAIAVLARTNAQLGPIETALAVRGLAVRRSASGRDSPVQAAMRDASANTSPFALRAWAHDTLDDIDALETARARAEDAGREAARDAGRAADRPSLRSWGVQIQPRDRQANAALRVVEAERRVATALLDFLRDQPRGNGADFRAWVATTNPFDDGQRGGVELLSFHAAKGREWHTVFVTGLETGLLPHRRARTAGDRAEEARLVYVAVTRATDVLVLTRAERRGGYARKASPFVENLDLSETEAIPPPARLRRRSEPDRTLLRLHEWRADAAMKSRIVPSQLISDRDLSAIASARPVDAEGIDAATSIGPLTAERLAPEILPLLDTGSDPADV
jgi:DNA helicase-2/ATP-dependent DNA helicase PcrA